MQTFWMNMVCIEYSVLKLCQLTNLRYFLKVTIMLYLSRARTKYYRKYYSPDVTVYY